MKSKHNSKAFIIEVIVVDRRSHSLCIMYGFTYLIYAFVLCMSCVLCAPPALLSALLSPSSAAAPSSASAPARAKQETGLTTYDQKQTGKYNIHLNIKDVAIIALDADHLDSDVGDFGEDYYEDYDLADFTVKPIFGIIDITSDKPSSTTVAPSLIPDEMGTLANETEIAANSSSIEEPLIKDPVNKTQSVVIIGPTPASPAVSILNGSDSSSGIVVTTPAPTPAKPSLADLANVQSAHKPSIFPFLFPTKPNEIPVQILLEPLTHKQASRHRPSANWHVRNRFHTTPSHNRRITPPHDIDDSSHSASHPAIGNSVYRKTSLKRQNCALSQNGQCQNSNRRQFGSPTL